MNKKELIQAAATKTDVPQTVIAQALAAITESINETLEKKESVTLIGFGTFSVRYRRARNGINPNTKKPMKIAAKEVVGFKVSKKK